MHIELTPVKGVGATPPDTVSVPPADWDSDGRMSDSIG